MQKRSSCTRPMNGGRHANEPRGLVRSTKSLHRGPCRCEPVSLRASFRQRSSRLQSLAGGIDCGVERCAREPRPVVAVPSMLEDADGGISALVPQQPIPLRVFFQRIPFSDQRSDHCCVVGGKNSLIRPVPFGVCTCTRRLWKRHPVRRVYVAGDQQIGAVILGEPSRLAPVPVALAAVVPKTAVNVVALSKQDGIPVLRRGFNREPVHDPSPLAREAARDKNQ
jgi:hypothetical protein